MRPSTLPSTTRRAARVRFSLALSAALSLALLAHARALPVRAAGVSPARAAAAGAAPVGCRAGRTLFHRGAIRAFVVVRREAGASYNTDYVCRPGSRTPRVIVRGEPYSRQWLSGLELFADRLGFVSHSEGVSSGSEVEIGWIDLRIGRVRTATIYASEGLQSESEEEPGLPKLPTGRVDYAIAEDGTVAVLGEGGFPDQWEVALLPVEARSLGRPRVLYAAGEHGEGLEFGSLAITATAVTWRTRSGSQVSAPR